MANKIHTFENFLKIVTFKPKTIKIRINGKYKKIKGMARFTTRNLPNDPYIKILFDDDSFLLIMISDKELYYAKSINGHIKSIKDEDIGQKEKLIYHGKVYQLGNKNDYQWVTKLYVGSFANKDIEAEARFSDYFPIKGKKEFLSLGWLSESGEHADINPVILDFDKIQIVE